MFLILEQLKQSNAKALAAKSQDEESKEPLEGEKATISIYSRKLQKDLLERAVFMSIKLSDFKQACNY